MSLTKTTKLAAFLAAASLAGMVSSVVYAEDKDSSNNSSDTPQAGEASPTKKTDKHKCKGHGSCAGKDNSKKEKDSKNQCNGKSGCAGK